MKITLDPGHGATGNPSPAVEGFYEGENNYIMAGLLKDELEKYKEVEVVLTRENVKDDPSLESRGKIAVENGSDLFYSIHSNAYSDPTAYGVTGFYSVETPGVRPLCEEVARVSAGMLPNSKVRRVITKTLDNGKDYYGVLRASEGVGYSMLVEHGFHTNPAEAEKLADSEWKKVWANKIAECIANFFGLEKKIEMSSLQKESTKEKLIRISEELVKIAESM